MASTNGAPHDNSSANGQDHGQQLAWLEEELANYTPEQLLPLLRAHYTPEELQPLLGLFLGSPAQPGPSLIEQSMPGLSREQLQGLLPLFFTFPSADWYKPGVLAVFAQFVDDPQVWGRIETQA